MKIIGITGTLGAGKGTLVDYLVKQKGYNHYSVRQYIIGEIEKRGLPVNRDSMVITANDLREKNNPAFIVEELYKQAAEGKNDAVIESIRTPGEIEFLKKHGDFILLAIDADPHIRYNRIIQRKSSTDQVDYETFIENEQREMTTIDPNKQNLKKCIEQADILLTNDGSIDDLYEQLDIKLRD